LESLAEYYPDAQWQRCTVHWYRNVLSVVPRGRMKEVAAMLKAIHAQEDAAAAGTQWGLKRYMNMDRLKEMKRQQQEKQEVMAG
jgi:transposase-like protein